jgi:transcriptional regulator
MREKGLKNHESAAKKLGVSETVLSAIKRGAAVSEGRCKQETLALVATRIGCKLEDLEAPPLE